MSTNELIYASATAIAQAIRERKVSSEEVVKAYLARVEAVNPTLNAVVQLNPEARTQARRADEALARGENVGPLHGVPFTVKEAFEVAGLASTGGTLGRKSFVAQQDATTVKQASGNLSQAFSCRSRPTVLLFGNLKGTIRDYLH